MSKDYAKKTKNAKAASRGMHKKRKPVAKANSMPGTISGTWLLVGIIISAAIMGSLYLKVHHINLLKDHSVQLASNHDNIKTAKAHVRKPPEFDFYTILPKQKVWAPADTQNNQTDTNSTPTSTPTPTPAAATNVTSTTAVTAATNTPTTTTTTTSTKQVVAAPSSYILQVAAFKQYSDADNLKAKLILQGLPANIDAKPVNGWTRVWLGPFKTQQALQAAQSQLASADKLKGMIIPVV